MEVCRACLSSDKNMMQLNETFINGYNLLTNISIKPLDGLPQCACEACVSAVNHFMDFREQCIQSESCLKQQLLEIIKYKREEYKNNENSTELKKYCVSPPKKEILPKRRRGRPRKDVATTDTQKREYRRSRRIETTVLEVQKKGYSKEEELSLSHLKENGYLDFIKEEIEYEDFEILDIDDNLNLNSNLEPLAVKPNVSDNVPKSSEKRRPIKSKTTKNSTVTETDFPCGLCEKLFETPQSINNHLEEHKDYLKCEICQAPFTDWQPLLAHRIKHVPKKYHHCHICAKRLHSVETLEYHYLLKHSDKNLQDIKLPCKLCKKAFSNPDKLKKHVSDVHSTKKYVCNYCNKISHSRNGMKVHLRLHSDVKKYVCDTCGDGFKQSTALKSHIWRKHTPTRVYCPRCHRIYPNDEALQKHVCPQAENKMCPVCGKVFLRTDRLNKHILMHSDVRQFKCEQCPKSFKSRDNLTAHMNRHSEHRPLACPHCPKRFYTSSVLSRHKRIHSGVRPYVCKVCSKAFNTNYNLKFHMRVHGEYLVAHRTKETDDNDNAHVILLQPPGSLF